MTELFVKIFNMSVTAGWIVQAVLLLRPFLKKAPKWINCLLWSIVALRLVIPFALESPFSLIPSAEVIPQAGGSISSPAIHSGIPAINGAVNPVLLEHFSKPEAGPERFLITLTAVWLTGLAALVIYSAISYWKLRRQVRVCILLQKNIYICDDVVSPFILGVIRPKIYIPSGMGEEQLQHVLAHENAHIKRRDHWWKPIGFALLTVYWFNPLLWLAYVLLCRDIEQACDEKVIAQMDDTGKKGYSAALLACSVHRRMIMACPVAFGEVSVKARIKGILSYKKPGFWIILASAVVCVIVAVCFLTSPKPCAHDYHGQVTVGATCTQEGVQTYTCEHCQYAYTEPVPVLAHTYDQGTITHEATCTYTGIREYACTGCGTKKTEAVQMIPHTAGEPFITVEANCTEQGQVSATCTQCGVVFVTEVLETNDLHDLKEEVLQAATCSAEGQGLLSCTRCDYTENRTYEKLAHNYYNGITTPGCCIYEGTQQQICAACGAERWLSTGMGEHVWTENPLGVYCTFCLACKSVTVPYTTGEKSNWTGVIYDPSNDPPAWSMPTVQIWPQ